MVCKPDCKWCAQGQCWNSGQIQKPEGVTKKTAIKKPNSSNVMGNGKGGGKPSMDMVQMMMHMMMQMKGGKGGSGTGGGSGAKGGDCKWCKMGECWTHGAGAKQNQSASKERIAALDLLPATPEEVEVFLSLHPGLEEHAVERMKKADPKIQRLIIDQGDMSDANNTTAVLVSRIKRAHDLRPGDWVCTACNDLQYAKNTQCRKCGSPKTAGAGL